MIPKKRMSFIEFTALKPEDAEAVIKKYDGQIHLANSSKNSTKLDKLFSVIPLESVNHAVISIADGEDDCKDLTQFYVTIFCQAGTITIGPEWCLLNTDYVEDFALNVLLPLDEIRQKVFFENNRKNYKGGDKLIPIERLTVTESLEFFVDIAFIHNPGQFDREESGPVLAGDASELAAAVFCVSFGAPQCL